MFNKNKILFLNCLYYIPHSPTIIYANRDELT